ncbi:MAG: hypothetical protein WCV50_06690 [Patescibacteria group bacterium]|jgi:hypothetical protein
MNDVKLAGYFSKVNNFSFSFFSVQTEKKQKNCRLDKKLSKKGSSSFRVVNSLLAVAAFAQTVQRGCPWATIPPHSFFF